MEDLLKQINDVRNEMLERLDALARAVGEEVSKKETNSYIQNWYKDRKPHSFTRYKPEQLRAELTPYFGGSLTTTRMGLDLVKHPFVKKTRNHKGMLYEIVKTKTI